MAEMNEPATLASPGKAARETFKHTPLQDPKSQIRLLELQPGHIGDDIKCNLHVIDRVSTPEYEAISYTWGDPECVRLIYIDGKRLPVRENCFHALSQVRLANAPRMVWQDAICIDQSNNFEKGHQVQEIASVFKNAKMVLVSIAHDDDAAFLAEWLEKLHEIFNVRDASSLEPLYEETISAIERKNLSESTIMRMPWAGTREGRVNIYTRIATWLQEITTAGIERFRSAIYMLACDPYWRRLWIFPELALARDACIFFGSVQCSFAWLSNLENLEWHDSSYPDGMDGKNWRIPLSPITQVLEQVRRVRLRSSATGLFGGCTWSQLAGLQCSVPRDRIFALIPLIDWESLGIPPITVDYEKPAPSLALECVKFCGGFDDFLHVLQSLNLDYDHARTEGEAFLGSRKIPELPLGDESCYGDLHQCREAKVGRNFLIDEAKFWQLHKDPTGRFVIPYFSQFSRMKEDTNPIPGAAVDILLKTHQVVFGSHTAYPNDPSEKIVAIVSQRAQENDVIVRISHLTLLEQFTWVQRENRSRLSQSALVLRKYDEHIYEVVGTAIISDKISWPGSFRHRTGVIALRLDPADAMAAMLRSSRLKKSVYQTGKNGSELDTYLADFLNVSFTSTRFSSYAVRGLRKQKSIVDICADCGRILKEESGYDERKQHGP